MEFFPQKGRKSKIEEKYNFPVLRTPNLDESGRATFEFNQELIDQLGLTPNNYLVFAIENNSLYATVVSEIPEGTKPRMLSVGKSEQATELGKVRKASSKPVAEWMYNSLSWLSEQTDLMVKPTEQENVYELVDQGKTIYSPLEEAQLADRADADIAEQEDFFATL